MFSERTRPGRLWPRPGAVAQCSATQTAQPHCAAPGKGNHDAVAAIKAQAAQRALDVRVIIDDIRRIGIKTLQGIADELNAREIETARGGRWYPTTVRNVLRRC